jgi:sterol 24-C-methyltransferase
MSKPLINKNKPLQDYYHSLESRIGYSLVLGGTRHFGYYKSGTKWPFPISKALRAMEDHLISNLILEADSKILDAGCGVGHVSIHLAEAGYQMQGIDVVDHHIEKARRNVAVRGLEDKIKIDEVDYHNLKEFEDGCFDGVFTMETFVHATDTAKAVKEFFRVLRPGGSIALYEYDHPDVAEMAPEVAKSLEEINKGAAMPAYDFFKKGVLEKILETAGFRDVVVQDLSENVLPMLRMFYVLAFVPYWIIRVLGLKKYFVNTVAGYEGYKYRGMGRYIAVSAGKPLVESTAESKQSKNALEENEASTSNETLGEQ